MKKFTTLTALVGALALDLRRADRPRCGRVPWLRLCVSCWAPYRSRCAVRSRGAGPSSCGAGARSATGRAVPVRARRHARRRRPESHDLAVDEQGPMARGARGRGDREAHLRSGRNGVRARNPKARVRDPGVCGAVRRVRSEACHQQGVRVALSSVVHPVSAPLRHARRRADLDPALHVNRGQGFNSLAGFDESAAQRGWDRVRAPDASRESCSARRPAQVGSVANAKGKPANSKRPPTAADGGLAGGTSRRDSMSRSAAALTAPRSPRRRLRPAGSRLRTCSCRRARSRPGPGPRCRWPGSPPRSRRSGR